MSDMKLTKIPSWAALGKYLSSSIHSFHGSLNEGYLIPVHIVQASDVV